GIDLTASAKKASAVCIISASSEGIRTTIPATAIVSDADILALVRSEPWDCVALDGPRSEPKGFTGFVERDGTVPKGAVRSRKCEREVNARIGPIFFYSPRARSGVREWLARSVGLFAALDDLGDRLIEVFPHATFVAAVNGVERRSPNPLRPKDTAGGLSDRQDVLRALLGSIDVGALKQGNAATHDVLDAAAAATTALMHLLGATAELGDAADGGLIVVPRG
ncbi:MAG: DUF429 domain-containing protein, partial [Proteobacteria bacterium]